MLRLIDFVKWFLESDQTGNCPSSRLFRWPRNTLMLWLPYLNVKLSYLPFSCTVFHYLEYFSWKSKPSYLPWITTVVDYYPPIFVRFRSSITFQDKIKDSLLNETFVKSLSWITSWSRNKTWHTSCYSFVFLVSLWCRIPVKETLKEEPFKSLSRGSLFSNSISRVKIGRAKSIIAWKVGRKQEEEWAADQSSCNCCFIRKN